MWMGVSLALPLTLGSGAWLAYQAGFAFLSESLAGPFCVSAPFAPMAAVVLFFPKGPNLVGPVTVAVLGNRLPYAACGCLHARWAALSKLDRWLRLAPVVRPLFFSVLPSSTSLAFGDLNKFIAVFGCYINALRDHGSPFAAQVPGHHVDMQPTVGNH